MHDAGLAKEQLAYIEARKEHDLRLDVYRRALSQVGLDWENEFEHALSTATFLRIQTGYDAAAKNLQKAEQQLVRWASRNPEFRERMLEFALKIPGAS